MKAIAMFAIAGVTLAGLAILKCVQDSLDDLASDDADADAAVEQDGWFTVHPIINEGRN